MNDLLIFFIAQSVIIIGAMLTAYVKIRIAIATLQTDVKHITRNTDQLKADHVTLSNKVSGISRHVAKIESGCKFMKDST